MNKLFFIFLSVFLLNVTLSSAQNCNGGNDCNKGRYIVEETGKYFEVMPTFRCGIDSLIKFIDWKLNDKILIANDTGVNKTLVILIITSKRTLSKLESLIEKEYKLEFDEKLKFLFELDGSWCPGYFYNKKTQKKEYRASSTLNINFNTVNGRYAGCSILYLW